MSRHNYMFYVTSIHYCNYTWCRNALPTSKHSRQRILVSSIVNSITGHIFNKNITILTLASCHRVDPNFAITTCSVRIYSVFKLSPLLTNNLDRRSTMGKRCHLSCSIEMWQWWTPVGCMNTFDHPVVKRYHKC